MLRGGASVEGREANVEGRGSSGSSLCPRSVNAYITDCVVDLPFLKVGVNF